MPSISQSMTVCSRDRQIFVHFTTGRQPSSSTANVAEEPWFHYISLGLNSRTKFEAFPRVLLSFHTVDLTLYRLTLLP